MVPVTLPNGYDAGDAWSQTVWLRPWCGADELVMGARDAAAAPPTVRATALLARCLHLEDGGRRAGKAFVRALVAGDREALLLHLRRITLGDRFSCVLACPACGGLMDLDLDVGQLLVAPYSTRRATHEARVRSSGRTLLVRFRLPNGDDQETVVPLARRDPAAAVRAVVERCVHSVVDEESGVPHALQDEAIEQIGVLMAERDPQAEILLDAECPACGSRAPAVFDAASYVQEEIGQHGDALLRQIHLLASRYHWSERAILRLSARRRRMYLDLIAEDQLRAGRPA